MGSVDVGNMSSAFLSAGTISLSSGSSITYPNTDLLEARDDDGSCPSSFSVPFNAGVLYGRTLELGLLHDALQNVLSDESTTDNNNTTSSDSSSSSRSSSSSSQTILIHGESGSGKSALVRSFRDAVRTRHADSAFFVEGKFDQNTDSRRPYSAIVDAVTQLCNSITESEYLDAIKSSIEKQLKAEISVLFKLIPALEVITRDMQVDSSDQQVGRATSNYAFQLFMDTFRSFFKVVCNAHVVVLFLDDVQWADAASRQLIAILTLDGGINNLILISAYRDDELETSSALSWIGGSSNGTDSAAIDIPLGPLSEPSVNEMVAGLTGQRLEQTKALSELVGRKTGRNAYFVAQFLEDLQRRHLLSFNVKSERWEWDLEQIDVRTDVSDNVVTLLTKKISSMPRDVQQVLMLGSCLGFVIDANALEQIVASEGILSPTNQGSSDKVDQSVVSREQAPLQEGTQLRKGISRYQIAFTQAVEGGLIEKATASKYKFSHDRVQQAASGLVPTGEAGVSLHIRIGKTILKMSATEAGEEWMFFAGVDLLIKFTSQLAGDSRAELARLCLKAGQAAASKSAFIPATQYLKTGIELLDPTDRWTKHYDLCLELHSKGAELGRTYGDFDSALALVDETIAHGRSFKDKLPVFSAKAFILGGQDKLPEAIQACKDVLSELGARLPPNPKMRHVLAEFFTVKLLVKGRKPHDILKSLRPMTDEKHVETMQFLFMLGVFAWHANLETLVSLTFLRLMKLTLRHGLCKRSPFAFATYGMILGAFGDYKTGYAFGRVALDMRDSMVDARECFAATTVVVESFLTHLQKPLNDSLASLLHAHEVGMQTGEIDFSALCLCSCTGIYIVLGTNLDSFSPTLLNFIKFFRQYGQGMQEGLNAPWLQFVLNLQGKSADPLVLTGDAMDEKEFLRRNTERNAIMAVRHVHVAKMFLYYIFCDLEAAEQSRILFEEGTGTEGSHYMVSLYSLFSGLTSLGLARKNPDTRRQHSRRARKHIHKLAKLEQDGSVNATLALRFLLAEQLSLKGSTEEVKSAFEVTIALAARTGSRLIQALACERMGYFMLERRKSKWAGDYLRRACSQFADYGAAAKVAQSEKYFNLLGFKRPLSGMLVGPAQPRRLPPTTVATEIHSIGVTKTNDNNHRFGLDSTGNNRNLREERIDKRDSLSSGLSASKAQVASSSPFGKEDLLRSPMVPSIPEEP